MFIEIGLRNKQTIKVFYEYLPSPFDIGMV